MSNKLLPCPFCGSDRITVMPIRDGAQASCKDCCAKSEPMVHGPNGVNSTWEGAHASWNRRKVKVKPLKWKLAKISDEWDRFSVETIFGSYEALEFSDGTCGFSSPDLCEETSVEHGGFKTIEDAKAAAQADYEQRILSAIEGATNE